MAISNNELLNFIDDSINRNNRFMGINTIDSMPLMDNKHFLGIDHSGNYRIVSIDKDAALNMIEKALKEGVITSKDLLMLFSKFKDKKL